MFSYKNSKVKIKYIHGILKQKSEVNMKKFLFSVGLALTIAISVSNISYAEELQYYDIKPANEQQTTVKRCPCKKYFVEHLGLTKEQVKFFDANRKAQEKELKPVNTKIRANYKQMKEIKSSDLADDKKQEKIGKLKDKNTKLKEKSAKIKVKYNEKFEKSLTDEQLKTLEYMRELKKQGKSCCPCGKNRYY